MRLAILLALFLSGALLPRLSAAQVAPELALEAGHWIEARDIALAELARGGAQVGRLVLLYRSLGIAHARLGETDQARRAFVCALALDAGLRLPNTESVEVRSPFMEARGFWTLHPERLSARAHLSEDGAALIVELVDPAALAARTVVRARAKGQAPYLELAVAPAASTPVDLAALGAPGQVEFTLALIDENGNRLWSQGTDAAPLSLAHDPVSMPVSRSATSPATFGAPRSPGPERAAHAKDVAQRYSIASAVSFVVAAGAAAYAVVNHVERQRLAADWNKAECDGTGETRAEVCASEHRHLKRAQWLAVGFYGVAGAALAAGIATLLGAPPRRGVADSRALGCGAGPGLVGVGCSAHF